MAVPAERVLPSPDSVLPAELRNASDLIKRYDAAKKRRAPWETLLRECYDFAIPQRELFTKHAPGARKNRHIFDSTAVIATQEFASRLQATMVPPWRRWSKLTPGPELSPEDQDSQELQEFLEDATETLFTHINHSNFATQTHEAFLDLACGTLALTLQKGTTPDKILEFNAVPVAMLALEEGPNGTIETVWEDKSNIPARNIERLYPGAKLTDALKKSVKDEPDKKVPLVQGVIFHPKDGNYYGVLVHGQKGPNLIWAQNFGPSSPYIVARWFVVPGEIYGRGPLMTVLADIKTANKVVEFILRHAALQIAPPLMSVTDGVINPYNLRLDPMTVIPVQSNDQRNPSIRAMEVGGNFNVAQLVLEDLRTGIKQALFNDLRRREGPVQSATEVAIQDRDTIQALGSNFGRIQAEFVERLVARAVFLLRENGKIADFEMDGREVTLKHMSPLARAQDQEDLLAMRQYFETIGVLGPEVVALATKVEDVPSKVAQLLGIDPDLMRSETERTQLQEQVAGIIAAQQLAGQQANAGGPAT